MAASEKTSIKDLKRFVEDIKDEKLSDVEQFFSFDIKDMYPSLPKYDVLSEIKNRINDNNFLNGIDKCALIELYSHKDLCRLLLVKNISVKSAFYS